jgi:hypothetical protein
MWNINPIQIQAISWKTGHAGGGHIWEGEGERGSKEGKNGWATSYTRMNIEFLKLLKSP